jgi:hypothetical protein
MDRRIDARRAPMSGDGSSKGSRLRIVVMVLGALFTVQGIGWLIAPARMAASLDMPVLDGLARSTQFGDFFSFFLTLGVGTLAAVGLGRPGLLFFPAALLGCAAFGRVVAWALHGADFALAFIAVETVGSAILIAAARRWEE